MGMDGVDGVTGEMWRKVPGTKCKLSNFGRLRNRLETLVTPRVRRKPQGAEYQVKEGGVYRRLYLRRVMPKVWPEAPKRDYDEGWTLRIRGMNGSTEVMATSARQGWRHLPVREDDPWETMALWNVEREYFNFAQYVPVV